MKKILNIFVFMMLLIIFASTLIFVNYKFKNTPCKDLIVLIDYNKSSPLLTQNDVKSQIIGYMDSIVGCPLKQIDLTLISDLLKGNPYLKNFDILTTFNGEIKIRMTQRRPILRVCNIFGNSYYISEDGVLLNVRPFFPVRVPIVNGDVFTPYNDNLQLDISKQNDENSKVSSLVIYQLYKMGLYLDNDEWLKLFIDQVYVSNKNFILIPRIGNYSIIFGTIEKMNEKFDKLKAFIERGINKVGWDKYKIINLLYDNQIVCTKIN